MKSCNYKVFDCWTNKYLPGIYQAKDLREVFADALKGRVNFNPSAYAKNCVRFQGRYLLEIADDEEINRNWKDEWDNVRLRILRGATNEA